MLHVPSNKGFSLVELLVVMGMMTILLSIGGLSLAAVRTGSQLDLIASEVRSEIMRVQAETVNGYPSGIYFESGRYVYFQGTSYTEGAPTNEESTLSGSLTFAISLPNDTVLFNSVTGNPSPFSSPYQVTISDASSEDRNIAVNAWGVVEVQ